MNWRQMRCNGSSAVVTVIFGLLHSLSAQSVRFGVIGDYGLAGAAEPGVSQLVQSWNPDFIITTGNNN